MARKKEKGTLRAKVKSVTLYHGRANTVLEFDSLYVELPVELVGDRTDPITDERQQVVDQDGLNALVSGSLSAFEDAEFERGRKQVNKHH